MASTLDRRSLIRTASRVLPASVAGLLAACTDEDPAGAVIALRLRKAGNGAGGEAGLAHTTDEWYRNDAGPEGVLRALLTVLAAADAG